MSAGYHFDKRRLSRAVLTAYTMNLLGPHVEINSRKSVDAGIQLPDILQPEKGVVRMFSTHISESSAAQKYACVLL
jgi:hypothetical protein